MKFYPLILVVLWLAVILQMTEQAPPDSPERTCKKVAAQFTKRQITGITQCTKSMKFKGGKDKSKKMNCILRCVMIRENLLLENGQATPEAYNKFVQTEFPPSVQDKFNGTFWNCMSMAYKQVMVAGFKSVEEDEYCTTYDPFIKCLMGNVPGLCNWS